MKPLTFPPRPAPAPPLLKVSVSAQGTSQIVTVSGELDVSRTTEVGNVIDRALAERPETLLLDLSELEFCDSSGVHLILRTNSRTEIGRTRFLVIPPTGAARRVFDLCCVEDYVTFVAVPGDAACA